MSPPCQAITLRRKIKGVSGGGTMRHKKGIIFLLIPIFLSACILPDFLREGLRDLTKRLNIKTHVSPSQTPVPARKTLQITERTYNEESDEPRYEIQAVWFNLIGEGWQIDSFNREVDDFVQRKQDDFLAAIAERQPQNEGQEGVPPLNTLSIDYELKALKGGVVSTQLTITQYIALSVHPFTISRAVNYDARAGEFLTLSDLFYPEADYLSLILNAVDKALQNRDFGYEAGNAGDVMGEHENWNLTSEGLRVNFDAYEVGPYAAGPQTVIISWEELAEVLNPQGPAGIFYP
jgi:hypothetical protein